ncbi:hypothetical protein GTCCBUS3UF5_34850 [Geobacillus thermoleovorans CCB_US3_UF5]|uniref:Uncharacterized protein n=1 Tax=Geobacillus thermoleovorans CCB_US3_UF5 TaxID=1111068 RepID=A0ABN4A2F4_GEOTH|nr:MULTISPECIES: hypothetical protein [Geobacillus]AEV20786.1 hypothetical protein GTCCBUS3UF5_34850 [Geobacillus thermoleovorans CCB_US3_UF5]QDY74634.1 hypothetical protein FP515_16690 [Geobacillus thermoleovorans]GAJ57449.1 hypothetical protein B23_0638 [Geobacillus thermoleovorans B23]
MEELLRQILSKLDNMEKGFLAFQEETRQRFEQMDGRLTEMNGRLVGLEQEMGAVKERLDRVETRLNGVETRLDGVETELTEVKETLHRVETPLVDDVQILLRKIHEKVEEKSFEIYALNRRLHHAEAAIEQLQSKA